MKCTCCQAEIPETSRFCTSCGAPAEKTGAPVEVPPPPAGPENMGGKPVCEPTLAATGGGEPHLQGTLPPSTLPPGTPTQRMEATAGTSEEISKIFETSGVCPKCFAPLERDQDRCPECGYQILAEVSSSSRFCTGCGQPFQGTGALCERCRMVPPPPPVPQPTYVPPPVPSPSPVKPTRTGLVIGLVLGGLLVLGILGAGTWFFVLRKGHQNPVLGTGESQTATTSPTPSSAVTPRADEGGAGSFGVHEDPSLLKEQAGTAYRVQDFQKAEEAIQRYLREVRTDADGFRLGGDIAAAQGNQEESVNRYLTARALVPDNPAYALALGRLYSQMGFPDKSVPQLRDVLKKEPLNQEALPLLVSELRKMGARDQIRALRESYRERFRQSNMPAVRDLLRGQDEGGDMAAGSGPGMRPGMKPKPGMGGRLPGFGNSAPMGGNPSSGSGNALPATGNEPPQAYQRDVNVMVDASALVLPGKSAEVELTLAGNSRKFSASSGTRFDGVEPGTYNCSVTVRYFNETNRDKEGTYSGTGVVVIRYSGQRLYLRRVGDRIFIQ